MPSAVRLTLRPSDEPALGEALGELLASWSVASGELSVWVSEEDADEGSLALKLFQGELEDVTEVHMDWDGLEVPDLRGEVARAARCA